MYNKNFLQSIQTELDNLREQGKLKTERIVTSPQGPEVEINGKKVLMFAANNYLGLSNNAEIASAAKKGIDSYGYGLSSVRFICGTQDIHRELEKSIAKFLGTEDAILYSTCFMANQGFFASIINEPLGTEEEYKDAIYSDALNHASIIDAFKLVKRDKLEKRIYPHADTAALEEMLKEDEKKGFRNKFIVTDGVFSMEGDIAPLQKLSELAKKYEAILFVDDAHGVGVLGQTGAGAPQHEGVHGQMDVLSGTFGKALGGALGGYIAAKQEVVDLLRQKSRTYMFSNSLPPAEVFASLKALELLQGNPGLVEKSKENTRLFRQGVTRLGFKTLDGSHPIVPVMLGEASVAQAMSRRLLEEGLYVVGLWFPVVPEGEARLRFQVSAVHSTKHIEQALEILEKVGKEMKLI